MLQLENALSGILVSPLNLMQRITRFRKISVKFLKGVKRLESHLPLLVPHRKLGHEHESVSISASVVRSLSTTHLQTVILGEIWNSIVTQVLVETHSDAVSRSTWQVADAVLHLIGVNHACVERHAVEHRCQDVVIHGSHYTAFCRKRSLERIRDRSVLYVSNGLIAIHDALVAVFPDPCSHLRL